MRGQAVGCQMSELEESEEEERFVAARWSLMKCWTCQHIGNVGKDLRGAICWCLLHNLMRDPNLGCGHPDELMPERRS